MVDAADRDHADVDTDRNAEQQCEAVLILFSGRCNLPHNCHFCFQRGISATICRIYSVLPPCYVGFPFLLIQD